MRPYARVVTLSALALLGAGSAPSRLPAQTAPGRVAVEVRSAAGAAVEGVSLRSGRARAFTDAEGRAELVVPAGPTRVRAERIGYAPEEAEVVVPAGGRVTLALVLQEAAVEAEGVVVTTTRADRRIEDEPLRVEVIPREEVEEKILMTPGDIAMLLNETAGLRVQPTAPSLGGASVRIQGMRGRYTLVLADGLPLHGGQGGALAPLQIPPMDLGQVEVIKGAASALYGATALGGVVNLVSRRPESARELLLNGTTRGGGDAVLWLAEDPDGPWAWSLLAGAHGQGRADVDADGWADLPGYRRALVRPRLVREDGRGGSVRATLGAMVEDRFGGTLPGATTPAGTAFREEMSTARGDAGVVARVVTGGGRIASLRGSASLQRHEHRFGERLERDRHLTAFAEGSLAGADGAHTWVVGAALQSDAYRARDVSGFDYSWTVPSLFAQDEARLTSALTVSASARADHHPRFGAFVSPRLSALVSAEPWTVRASAGTGWFAPTPFTEEVEAVGLGRVTPLPAGLDAERGRSASLDVGRHVGALELNVTLFASEVRGAVRAEPDGDGLLTITNAPGDVRSWGTELLARYDAEPFHVTATWVVTRSTEPARGGAGALGERRTVPLTPRHTGGIVAAWESESWGRVGAELYYTGRQELEDDPYRTASRPYAVVGFLVERRVGERLRVFLNAENVLDTRQTRWTPLLRPARSPVGRWTTDAWAPLEGRIFNAGLRLAL